MAEYNNGEKCTEGNRKKCLAVVKATKIEVTLKYHLRVESNPSNSEFQK